MYKIISIIALLCTSLTANAYESNQLLGGLTELSQKGEKMMAEKSVSLAGAVSSSLLPNKKILELWLSTLNHFPNADLWYSSFSFS